jgi:hypothetical protein
MLPSSCVPYKHFASDDIEYCLEEAVEGRDPADIEADSTNKMGVHRVTIRGWLNQWSVSSAEVASVSSEKFSTTLTGGFKTIFRRLSARFQGKGFFKRIQPALCRDYPPMGLFRPLIKLSSSAQG